MPILLLGLSALLGLRHLSELLPNRGRLLLEPRVHAPEALSARFGKGAVSLLSDCARFVQPGATLLLDVDARFAGPPDGRAHFLQVARYLLYPRIVVAAEAEMGAHDAARFLAILGPSPRGRKGSLIVSRPAEGFYLLRLGD